VDKTTMFNGIVAFVLAVVIPVLTEHGYTGEVPAGWVVFVGAAIAGLNALLKYLSKTKFGQAHNV